MHSFLLEKTNTLEKMSIASVDFIKGKKQSNDNNLCRANNVKYVKYEAIVSFQMIYEKRQPRT